MRRSSGWFSSTLALALLGTAAGPLVAQTGEEEQEEDRCVCVDTEEIHEHTREAMEDARRAMRRAREQVRATRFEVAPRPRLGIAIDDEQGARWDSVGVRVTGVPDESPASEAGIREDDVIVALDGRRLTAPLPDPEDEDGLDEERSLPVQRLILVLGAREPGDEVEVTYLRNGEEATATVELGSLRDLLGFVPPERPPAAPRPPGFRDGRRAPGPAVHPPRPSFPRGFRGELGGLTVADLNPDLGEYFGTDEGALITGVPEDSALGLRSGDVVLRVGDRKVGDPADLRRILWSYEEDEEVRFRVRRHGAELDVTGTMP